MTVQNSSTALSLPPVHTLWVGSELGPLELLCIKSWLRQGHEVFVHSYERIPLPEGAKSFDASALCSPRKVFRNRNGSLAPFSDVYRVLILQAYPVLWLDTDVFLLRPFDFGPNVIVKEGNGSDARANNSVMRLRQDHPILLEVLNRWQRPWKAIPWDHPRKAWPVITMGATSFGLHAKHLPWGALGSLAMEKCIRENGFDGAVLGFERSLTAHRVDLFSALADANVFLQDPIVYVHLYRSQLKRDLANPVPGSVYARLWEIGARQQDALAKGSEPI